MIFRIQGDFFNRLLEDEKGPKVLIGKEGLPHLEKFPFREKITEGRELIVCDGELQVETILEFDQESRGWYARIDWSTRRDLHSPADGLQDYQDASPGEKLAILKYESEVHLKLILHDINELEKMNMKSVDELPEKYYSWGKEFLRSINILKEMVEILT